MLQLLRRGFRSLIQPLLWIGYRRYLSKSRWYHHDGLHINVLPSVFHPGIFFSTKIMMRHIKALPIAGKRVLELGAGSGMVALAARRASALVTASDINPEALQAIEASAQRNGLDVRLLHSDLFDKIAPQPFDYILINPPYFPKDPSSDQEYAFYCGSDFGYFHRLFGQLGHYLSPAGCALMILSDDCEVERIQRMARESGLEMELVYREWVWGEVNFIFRIPSPS
ncbi:MAG: methyltransferase [Bacteroidota bacterium]